MSCGVSLYTLFFCVIPVDLSGIFGNAETHVMNPDFKKKTTLRLSVKQ